MSGDRAKLFEAYGSPLLDPAVRINFLRKAGIAYGLVFSLGFAILFWLPDALELQRSSAYLAWAKLPIGLIACLPIGALTGWLAVRTRWSLVSGLMWAIGGGLIGWIAGHVPYEGVNLIASLDRSNPFGAVTHPFYLFAAGLTGISVVVGMIAGFLTGLFELIVTEWAWDRSTASHRMGVRSILMLCACLPIAAALALYLDTLVNVPIRGPVVAVAWAVDTAVDRPDRLAANQLGYLYPYRDQLTSNYTVYWSGIQSVEDTHQLADVVDVVFDSGLALRCRYFVIEGSGTLHDCAELKP